MQKQKRNKVRLWFFGKHSLGTWSTQVTTANGDGDWDGSRAIASFFIVSPGFPSVEKGGKLTFLLSG